MESIDNLWPKNIEAGRENNSISDIPEWEEPDWDFIDYVNKLEKDWNKNLQQNLPKTDLEWLDVFPEAKAIIPDKIKEWIGIANVARIKIKEALEIINKKSAKENQWFWREVLKYIFPPVKELAMANRHIKRLQWLLPKKKNRKILWNKIVEEGRNHDLVSVAEHYGLKLHKSGNTYKALCIEHAENTPSFVIYPPSRFYCFGCHIKGDVINFVQIIERCSFKEAVFKLQNI